MIEIVYEALRMNEVKCVLCSTKKDFKMLGPLDQFKASPDLSILLMPIHLGQF